MYVRNMEDIGWLKITCHILWCQSWAGDPPAGRRVPEQQAHRRRQARQGGRPRGGGILQAWVLHQEDDHWTVSRCTLLVEPLISLGSPENYGNDHVCFAAFPYLYKNRLGIRWFHFTVCMPVVTYTVSRQINYSSQGERLALPFTNIWNYQYSRMN